ncbi:MAG TPA: hypothetical protein VGB36_03185 [Gammaproteobacteria bacterium]|jgi:hypothetical protein
MSESNTTPAEETSLGQDILALLKHWLRGRRGLIVMAVAVLAAGTYFGWGWLVAAGIAPILLALAPCAAMCALGLCMNRGSGNSCSSGKDAANDGAGGPVAGADRSTQLDETVQRKENQDA